MPSSSAPTVHGLENARARNEHIVNVGVDGIGISSEHTKLDGAQHDEKAQQHLRAGLLGQDRRGQRAGTLARRFRDTSSRVGHVRGGRQPRRNCAVGLGDRGRRELRRPGGRCRVCDRSRGGLRGHGGALAGKSDDASQRSQERHDHHRGATLTCTRSHDDVAAGYGGVA